MGRARQPPQTHAWEGWGDGRAHPLHLLQPEVILRGAPGPHPALSSSGRAECQVVRVELGRGWQGTRQLQTAPRHVAYRTTTALSRRTAAPQEPLPTSPQRGPACGPPQHGPVSQATVPVHVPGRAREDQPQGGSGGAPRRRRGPRKSQADGEGCGRRQQPLPPSRRPEAGTEPWETARPWAGGAPSPSHPNHICLIPRP